ncbi:MAG: stage 0 sporulation family protein [Eubacteriales bacterium]
MQYNDINPQDTPIQPPPEQVEIIGVQFKNVGKVYYFAPNGEKYQPGDNVIVETARGLEYGGVATGNRLVDTASIVSPLKNVIRRATKTDDETLEANKVLERDAFRICLDKIRAHKLEMKLVDVEYTFDNNKLLFYFTADGRVDFRDLVKDLASVFKTRIELRQIGIRDEAKLMGGLSVCGRVFCCSSFLGEFTQVSIKMAKEQGLSLNSSKISGACGRLMCCLKFEHDTYEAESRLTPKIDSIVQTPDGQGIVIDNNVLAGLVKVLLDKAQDKPMAVYHRDTVKVTGMVKRDENGRREDTKRD